MNCRPTTLKLVGQSSFWWLLSCVDFMKCSSRRSVCCQLVVFGLMAALLCWFHEVLFTKECVLPTSGLRILRRSATAQQGRPIDQETGLREMPDSCIFGSPL
jgi:hypothetical protein